MAIVMPNKGVILGSGQESASKSQTAREYKPPTGGRPPWQGVSPLNKNSIQLVSRDS